ncbi:hypothetical protein MAPG_05484 [Magnaporthiopsis poae ATCC 64411]|uniref:Multiprotein bridging factor 1 N-terminal domain-containing protein n=1 Tax=Magnaporthiopsis poae (strain ATCC 64411 / 73-15) TaxID=644358 RepID=A0A0C4DZI2_MAGP6|nr:hypothetical protein MAPG_05484 [Magnaporthiopsis poae ATCC 64411]
MSAWDVAEVKIGKGAYGGSTGPYEKVVKNNALRNQAARQGNLTSMKKVYGTANGSASALMNQQRNARIDRAEGPMPTQRDTKKERVQENLKLLCTHLEISRDQVAKAGNTTRDKVFMSKTAAPTWQPDPIALNLIENTYGWCIRAGKYGPKGNCKHAEQKLEYQNKIKKKWDGKQPLLPGEKRP